MPYTDPYAFRAELKRYDPRLEFEWSNMLDAWTVWAKSRDGGVHIIYRIPLGKLDEYAPQIIGAIEQFNVVKYGADEINRRIDKMIEDDEHKDMVQRYQDLDAIAGEAYDIGMRMEKSRVNNVGLPVSPPNGGGATVQGDDTRDGHQD